MMRVVEWQRCNGNYGIAETDSDDEADDGILEVSMVLPQGRAIRCRIRSTSEASSSLFVEEFASSD